MYSSWYQYALMTNTVCVCVFFWNKHFEIELCPDLYLFFSCFSTDPPSACSPNYLRLKVIQSKCLRVIGKHPKRTPNTHLYNILNTEPIPVIILRISEKFNLHNKHKHTKLILLYLLSQCFIVLNFYCRYLHLYLFTYPSVQLLP
jgi:hypothetical protein